MNRDTYYRGVPGVTHREGGLTMTRLTTNDPARRLLAGGINRDAWNAIYDQLRAYEDTGLEPEEIVRKIESLEMALKVAVNRNEALNKAEQEGRLVVLPCKVGDTVWILNHHRRAVDGTVESIHQNYVAGRVGRWVVTVYFPEFYGSLECGIDPDFAAAQKYLHFDDFGQTVFLTHEAAEAALKERGSDT